MGKIFIFISFNFQIRVAYNSNNGKPRGYAFIEFEHERDMHCKYRDKLWRFVLLFIVALTIEIYPDNQADTQVHSCSVSHPSMSIRHCLCEHELYRCNVLRLLVELLQKIFSYYWTRFISKCDFICCEKMSLK